MKLKLGDYFIETDERQFKVKKYIGKDKNDKDKDLYKTYAYCTTLITALKFIPQQVLRDNEDINVIKEKLSKIEQDMELIDKHITENENYKARYEELDRFVKSNYERDVFR